MARCYRCDTIATDPGRGKSPWARAIVGGEQVLVCPSCQADDPDWIREAESCRVCGSKRLAKTLGDVVCRACGHSSAEDEFSLD